MNVDDRHALGGVALDASARYLASLVGGIVEDLNVKQFAGVIEAGDGFDEALDYVAFIKDRKLNGDAGPMFDFGRGAGDVFRVDVIVVDEPITVKTVGSKDEKYEEVGNHHCQIEGVGVIDAAESAVRELVPEMAKGGLRREKCCDREKAWHDEGDFR